MASKARKDGRSYSILWDVHTWAGVATALFLFVIFFTGIFVLWRHELQRWADPHQAWRPVPGESVGAKIEELAAAHPDVRLRFALAHGGEAITGVRLTDADGQRHLRIDQATGALAPERSSVERILWYLHFFHQVPGGFYFTGLLGAVMLLALVTGLCIHWRHLPAQLFRFRPGAAARLVWTDAHKVLGTMGLPFLIVFSFTGAMICLSPLVMGAHMGPVFGGDRNEAARSVGYVVPGIQPAGEPGPSLPVDELLARAKAAAVDLDPESVELRSPGDANAALVVYGHGTEGLLSGFAGVTLRASDGSVLDRADRTHRRPGGHFAAAAIALHFVTWGGFWLKAVHALLALAGCVMLASGVAVYLARREAAKESATNRALLRLTLGATAGLICATGLLFAVNRLLPAELPWRTGWENVAFFGGWLGTFVFAFVRAPARRACRDLLAAGGAFSLCAAGVDLLRPPPADVLGVSLGIALLGIACVAIAARIGAAAERLPGPVAAVAEGS